MKKQITFIIVFLLNTILSFSQPTLTELNSAPVPGDIFIAYEADTSLQPGNGGANVTWNFGSLAITNNQIVSTFISPSSTPYPNAFPSATVVQENAGNYVYYNSNSNSYSVLGQIDSGDSLVYSPPMNVFCYPLTYNNACPLSNYVAEYLGDSIVGSNDVTADGYGTLILNGQTINSVLRVKSIHNETTYNIAGNINILAITYFWFDGINKCPLLEISTLQLSGLFSGYDKAVHVNSIISDVSESSMNINPVTVFPNPVSQSLFVKSIKQTNIDDLQVYNSMGEP